MTLIELLVVIVILTTLVAAAIPLLAPSSTERQLREAARGVNSFFQVAQARAVAQGRPIGVALERLSHTTNKNDNYAAVRAYIVEQPAPYSGFDASSAVQIAFDNGPTGGSGQVLVRFVRQASPDTTPNDGLPPGWDADLFPPGVIRPNDTIEVAGTRFLFVDTSATDANGYYPSNAGNPDGTLVTRPINNTGQVDALYAVIDNVGQNLRQTPAAGAFVPPYWSSPMPYKVLRQPVPASDQPFQLPAGTVVDLRASGVGDDDFFYWPADSPAPARVDNRDGVMIMFAPEGRIWRVYFNRAPSVCLGCNDAPVVDNVYLLVGASVPEPPPANQEPTLDTTNPQWQAAVTDDQREALEAPLNWLRGDSIWITIGASTGRVATVANEYVDPAAIYAQFPPPITPEVRRTKQILAARAKLREATQLGGR